MRDQIKNKKDSGSSNNSGETSEVGAGLGQIKKRMSKKQRDLCSSRVSSRLSQVGASYPESDYAATESSGKDSVKVSGTCKHSIVKSGAKVKARPVVKTVVATHHFNRR